MLQYFAIERFLYRLAQTEWADRLIVKGAIMLRAWGTPLGRPTRDIDFLGNIDNGWAMGAFGLILLAALIGGYLVLSGRVTINRGKAVQP